MEREKANPTYELFFGNYFFKAFSILFSHIPHCMVGTEIVVFSFSYINLPDANVELKIRNIIANKILNVNLTLQKFNFLIYLFPFNFII